jgi:hypothetical protein
LDVKSIFAGHTEHCRRCSKLHQQAQSTSTGVRIILNENFLQSSYVLTVRDGYDRLSDIGDLLHAHPLVEYSAYRWQQQVVDVGWVIKNSWVCLW